MEYNTIPGTDLKVSKICLGTWQFNGGQQSADKTWNAMPEEISKEIVDKALEAGVNFFDTAEGYLNSEGVVGRIFAGRRNDVILGTKFGFRVPSYTPEDIEQSVTNSLRKLQTDYIDLYQVHYPTVISEDMAACVGELKRQQSLGRIRHYGVSNFGPQNMKQFLEAGGKPVTNQIPYNLLWRSVEYEILPLCQKHNISFLPYSPLQQGLLTGKFLKPEDVPIGRRRTKFFNSETNELSKHGGKGAETETFETINAIREVCDEAKAPMASASLSWLLKQPSVVSVIAGCSNTKQVESNCKLVNLSQEIVDALSDASDSLKGHFGSCPDLWAEKSRIE